METCAFSATGDIYNTATIIKQNNYSNLCMQTIGSQLTRIDDSLDKVQINYDKCRLIIKEKKKWKQ